MATYTVLTNASKSNRSEVVVEFDVPLGNNSAGVPWRTVVAELRDVSGSVNPRKASDSAYVAELDAGQKIELAFTVEYDARLTKVKKVAVLDAAVTDKVAEFTTEFAALYSFYGTVRTV